MNNATIRRASPEDLSAIQELNYRLFCHDQPYDPLLNMDWPYGDEGVGYFKDRIAGKDGVCIVAVVDDKIVGYLCGGVMKPHSYRQIKVQAELENTFILEEYRRAGMGKKLFEALFEWSREQGAERIFVSAAAQNINAIAFYKEIGFMDYAVDLEYDVT